jgi:hypothetical protein
MTACPVGNTARRKRIKHYSWEQNPENSPMLMKTLHVNDFDNPLPDISFFGQLHHNKDTI